MLATLGFDGLLSVWDLSGSAGRVIVRRAFGRTSSIAPLLEFSPDDAHLFLQMNVTSVSIIDTRTFDSIATFSSQDFQPGHFYQWLDGGRKFIVAEGSGNPGIRIFDCRNRKELFSWSQVRASSMVVSPDNKHVLVEASDNGASWCIDLSSPVSPVIQRTLPDCRNLYGPAAFFADGRRVLAPAK